MIRKPTTIRHYVALKRCSILLLTALSMCTAAMNEEELKTNDFSTPTRNLRRNDNGVKCNVLEVIFEPKDPSNPGRNFHSQEWHCVPPAEDEDGIEGISYEMEGLDPSFVSRNEEKLSRGDSWINIPGATKSKGRGAAGDKVRVPRGAKVEFVTPPGQDNRRGPRALAAKEGENRVLVLRTTANDASCTTSAAQISENVFGPNDPVNLKTQYEDCSYGKRTIAKADDHPDIVEGVLEVEIDMDVDGANRGTVMNEITAAAQTKLGGQSLSTYDHVMYCFPPGTVRGSGSDWTAYAYLNNHRSGYNYDRVNKLSAQMHEIAHNLGLRHSGEGSSAYGDQSCTMGSGYSGDDTPKMCFNAAKSFEWGWYSDRVATVDPLVNSWGGLLIGASDYGSSGLTSAHNVILEIKNPSSTLDLYSTYNRQSGINSGVNEFQNQVTVVEGFPQKESTALDGLNEGEEHRIPNFSGSGSDLVVEVCEIVSGSPEYARVSVHLDDGSFGSTCDEQLCTSDSQCNDGLYCNGIETCDTSNGICQAGTPVVCNSDNDVCTDDRCDEASNSCVNDPIPDCCSNDADCNDGVFCNGVETCDTSTGNCQAGTQVVCASDNDVCTNDICDEASDSCVNVPNPDCCSDNAECDDGVFCNGIETCNTSTGFCEAGTPVVCSSDNDDCTDDRCDEASDSCVNVPIPNCGCGDGVCGAGEDCSSCPQDCGNVASCGNGNCDVFAGENCYNCPRDCAGQTKGKKSRRFCCGERGSCLTSSQCGGQCFTSVCST